MRSAKRWLTRPYNTTVRHGLLERLLLLRFGHPAYLAMLGGISPVEGLKHFVKASAGEFRRGSVAPCSDQRILAVSSGTARRPGLTTALSVPVRWKRFVESA